MTCENCEGSHDGTYGSGRFCSQKCARSSSTKNNRAEINAKVSAKLKGRKVGGRSFERGYDPRRKTFTKEDQIKGSLTHSRNRMLANKSMPCENLSKKARKTLVLAEQGGVCLWCGLNSWRDEPLVLELDHIDGNKKNNIRKNLRILCPNCHSQTPTWKNRKRKEKQEVGAGDGS